MRRSARLRQVSVCVAAVSIGLLVSGCDWTQLGYSTGHTGDNTTESTITASNVSTLSQQFVVSAGTTDIESPLTIANGVMYEISGDGNLYASSANGTTNCSGTPKTCSPLWTFFGNGRFDRYEAPVVENGVVYVTGQGGLDAFDANGKTNCFSSLGYCVPLWTTSDLVEGSPTVVNGTVIVQSRNGAGGTLEAFDANSVTNCSGAPKVCSPLWSSTAFGLTVNYSVAVSNNVAYAVGGDSSGLGSIVYAFDASGTTDCSGTPKVCSPLWQTSPDTQISGYPVVTGNTLYIDSFYIEHTAPYATIGTLEAFDASGKINCVGTPKMCTPLWQSPDTYPATQAPTVADGLVFITTNFGPIVAFDAAGSRNCSGVPRTCSPLWTTSVSGAWTSAVVGGNVLFAEGLVGGQDHTYAFDATGIADCAASQCSPLWSASHSPSTTYELTVANGLLYLGGSALPNTTNPNYGMVWAYSPG